MNAEVKFQAKRDAAERLGADPQVRLRHDWGLAEVEALFDLPFMDLMYRAQTVHRQHHAANRVQMSTLLSIKTGGCPEDCGYCPQSIHYETGVARDDMLPVEQVVEHARRAHCGRRQQCTEDFCGAQIALELQRPQRCIDWRRIHERDDK